mgnify:CR=1 FL=1
MVRITRGLKRCRERMKMSQCELAMLLGLTQTTVSNYERGLREPSIEILLRIAQVLDTSVDELLSD